MKWLAEEHVFFFLKKINRQLKLKFEVVDIESFYQQVEESGNVRLKLDVFVLETLNHYRKYLSKNYK